jgi:hypothetical protein
MGQLKFRLKTWGASVYLLAAVAVILIVGGFDTVRPTRKLDLGLNTQAILGEFKDLLSRYGSLRKVI